MGIPCVTTPLANDSLGATDGSEVLLGRDAGQLAAAIIRMLDNEALRQSIAEQAQKFVHTHFSWEATGQQLEAVLHNAIENHSRHNETALEDE